MCLPSGASKKFQISHPVYTLTHADAHIPHLSAHLNPADPNTHHLTLNHPSPSKRHKTIFTYTHGCRILPPPIQEYGYPYEPTPSPKRNTT